MHYDVEVTEEEIGRLHLSPAQDPVAVLLLGHGARGGIDSAELAGLAERLPARGITVARFEQPWKVAGRPLAGPAASLDRAWKAVISQVKALAPGVPLFTGGRSIGARVACRGFGEDQRGLVLSAFPLHPPGRPERSRIDELAGVAASALVVQTERDPFGGADELLAALAEEGSAPAVLVRLEGATHGPDVRSAAGVARLPASLDAVADAVAGFVSSRLGSPVGPPPV
ncbi:MAG: alpha/beta family hydrolase [Propionicimonas sp.]|nr:hypothetical protein [Propionicimonas sp.]